jgi:Fe-S cluster assembly protein SufB
MTKSNLITKSSYQFGWRDEIKPAVKVEKGLTEKIVRQISYYKNEPSWMTDFRLKAYHHFLSRPLPSWGPDLSAIDFQDIYYYLKPTTKKARSWEDVPAQIRKTYQLLGIPQAEQKFLAGVEAQFDSEMVYGRVRDYIAKNGVIFVDTDTAVKEYPELVRPYFGTIVSSYDNKFAALNSAVWSGGSFVYVPKGVKVELPLQAYFRINADKMGQFERTLIIADEGSWVTYIEGCTSPIYTTDSLHAAVVEIIVKKGARVRYTTIQNWSKNVYNLVTKRAKVEEEGVMEWIDANLGSKITMKYPSCILAGRKAKGEILSMAFAGKNQILDSGGKIIHLAPETAGTITSKGIAKDGGVSSYRGLVRIVKGAKKSKSKVKCDALILDERSAAHTFPHIKIEENEVEATHEAVTGRLNEDQLFYLRSRGLTLDQAETLLVNGFIEPLVKELPMEYAVEMNRLLKLEMEGAVG